MKKQTRTISITSGKGGVGKTTLVANLALALAEQGERILILDGDLGMANVDIMFNVRPTRTVAEVLDGSAQIHEVMVPLAPLIHLIPAGSGLLELQRLEPAQKRNLLDQVGVFSTGFDYMLIDTAPGIDDNVLYLNSAAQRICVIITPDPSSLADSYALIKVLNQVYRESHMRIICNQVKDESEGFGLYARFSEVAGRFLDVRLDYLASIPFDLNLRQAVRAQKLIMQSQPHNEAARAISKMAQKINGFQERDEGKGGLQFFWSQMVGVA